MGAFAAYSYRLGGWHTGAPKAEVERRVQQAATMLQLTEWMKRKPAQLSGGQRQRVAIG